ncbi:FAD/NAD(P)-binding protein [Cryptosporangium phraense]|uniref:FAD/NAD(P)-binding protein n=1 Tax=Cryptosporangium phraense TaxID=2593070 RepID=A0A545AG18_9ACTN|nr:FAD/NAD(P)-binding protein [Cryptosporangium phraense]TQS40278.1 FAD/NAD(P)-binding protein [Cryptosporangium phraense]
MHRVVLVGAGSRGTDLLERLTASGSPLQIDVVDPRPGPLPDAVRVHRTTAVDLVDTAGGPDGPQSVALASGCPLDADVVLLAQGRPGTRPTPEQWARADFADWHGLRYRRPREGDAIDLTDVPAGVDVLLRDAGALTGDLIAPLTLGRGGHYSYGEYRPSGGEPRIHLLPSGRPEWTLSLGPAWAERRAALIRAGVAIPHPAGEPVRPDAARAAFVLGPVASRTLIEPDTADGPLRASADPLLRTLAERGELAGWSGTGALLDRHGRAHPRRFAFGRLTGVTAPALDVVLGAVPAAVPA